MYNVRTPKMDHALQLFSHVELVAAVSEADEGLLSVSAHEPLHGGPAGFYTVYKVRGF
jgi:hypothetical protein